MLKTIRSLIIGFLSRSQEPDLELARILPSAQDSKAELARGASRYGNLAIWFSKGRDLKIFRDDIVPDLEYVLKAADLPQTIPITLHLYMVGKSEDKAHPVVMVCCVDPRTRKAAKSTIEQSGKLQNYPGFGLSSAALPLEASGVLRECQASVEWEDSFKSQPFRASPSTLTPLMGRRITVIDPDDGTSKQATGGPIIQVGEHVYQLTAGHLFTSNLNPPPPEYQLEWDLDECDLAQDFDDMFPSKNTANLGCRRRHTPLQEELGSSCVGMPVERRGTVQQLPIEAFSTAMTDPTTPVQHQLVTVANSEAIDYALIRIEDPGVQSILFSPSLDHMGSAGGIAAAPDEETDVRVVTARGTLDGILIPGAMKIMKRGTGKKSLISQNLCTVKLDGFICEGDCGSAVIDSKSGDLYGHVVLGCPGDRYAYFVPAVEVMKHIQDTAGISPLLYISHQPEIGEVSTVGDPDIKSIPPPSETFRDAMVRVDRIEHGGHTTEIGGFQMFAFAVSNMIGTGIFTAPAVVYLLLGNKVLSLCLWAVGFCFSFITMLLYLDYGGPLDVLSAVGTLLTITGIPQIGKQATDDRNGLGTAVPRTEKRARLRLIKSFHLIAIWICSFVVAFFFTSATNSMQVARMFLASVGAAEIKQSSSVFETAWKESEPLMALLLATITLTLIIVLPMLPSRRSWIALEKIMAVSKLLLISGITIAMVIVAVRKRSDDHVRDRWSWSHKEVAYFDIARAFLAVVFAFQGWELPFYVLGEINVVDQKRHKTRKKAFIAALAVVGGLYLAATAAFLDVVDYSTLTSMGTAFYASIFCGTSFKYQNAWGVVVGISALTNLISMSYVNSRVKQTIFTHGQTRFLTGASISNMKSRIPYRGQVLHYMASTMMVAAITWVAGPGFSVSLPGYIQSGSHVAIQIMVTPIYWRLIQMKSVFGRGSTPKLTETRWLRWAVLIIFAVGLFLFVKTWKRPYLDAFGEDEYEELQEIYGILPDISLSQPQRVSLPAPMEDWVDFIKDLSSHIRVPQGRTAV